MSPRPLMMAATWAACLLTPAIALAQTGAVFKCKHADGTVYFSDRSCTSGEQLPGKVNAARTAPARSDANQYLSVRCQRLRAARQRLDNLDETAEREAIQQEYQAHCAAEEQEASERVYRQAQDERERNQQAQRDAAQARERRAVEQAQCVELGSIIRGKREQLGAMTSGERADFERSQAAFAQRCKGS